MKFGEHLLGTVQFNRRADPRGDRAICGHAHKRVQPVRFEAEFPVKRAATWIVDCCDISFHLINFQAGRFEDVVQKHVSARPVPRRSSDTYVFHIIPTCRRFRCGLLQECCNCTRASVRKCSEDDLPSKPLRDLIGAAP
jgi:hypothetical protein